jgi:hypothetical protein
LTFYGGYKILVSAKSHVDFWPALGSWVGGVATVYAVIVAIISYNANKTENQRVLLFNVKTELDYELLPDVEIHIHQNLNVLLAIIFKIRRGEEVIEYDKELLVSKRDSLLMYKNKLIRKTKLLNKLRGLNVEYESEYEDYMHTLANILLANYFVIQFIDNKNIVDLEEEFNNLKNFCVFCEKYIVDNYYQKNNLTSNGFSNFFFITKLMETIRNYYNLKSYQL